MSERQLSWTSKEVPDREAIVTRYVLERHERERPNRTFVVFEDGTSWTYAQTTTYVRQFASGLANLGVRQGDRVLCWLPNSPDCLLAWLSVNWLGATYVPINTAYKGSVLEHVIHNSQAKLLISIAALYSRLSAINVEKLSTAVLCDLLQKPHDTNVHAIDVYPRSAVTVEVDLSVLKLREPIEPWDEQSIIYTSGTTGPSKGVLSSYCHLATTALVAFEGRADDNFRYMLTLPLFHVGGTVGVMGALLLGGSVAVIDRFDTKSFWSLVARTGSNCCTLLGAMATFLVKQEGAEDDHSNRLEWAYIVPYTDDAIAFSKRFGVDVYTMFNMSEISAPIVSLRNPSTAAVCGQLRSGLEARLVDSHDKEVQEGESGELILRADRPWSMNHGYNGNAEATALAWRNGWYHTGDMFKKNRTGDYIFIDRAKDAIRRRGENISSFEVERECLTYPSVREAAAVAVDSEFSEADVMVVISLVEGQSFDYLLFFEYLRDRMAYFMLPRYIRIMDELPKTPTQKVMKEVLRRAAVTDETWDREAHGIVVKS